jgi:SAM-dependent methyltransferase
MADKLNLGCGEFRKDGYVNVDYYSVSEPDVRHDLNRFPYPFDNDSFDFIESDHLMEHLENPFRVMRELHRIGRNGCRVRLRVPHFSRGFTHAEHKRGFDASFPLYFDPTFKGGYQGVPFQLNRVRLRWFAQPYLKKDLMPKIVYYAGLVIGGIFDFFANLSPFVCSRLWCFWVGGFEEIEFELSVKK